jgi:hypothetical protein
VADESCKAKIEHAGNLDQVLEQAKEIAGRCGCHAVTLVFKPKDGFTSVSIGCLRGRRKKEVSSGAP